MFISIQLPDLGPLNVPQRDQPHYTGHYRIARHYGYSLNYTLNVLNYKAIIITEGFFGNDIFFVLIMCYPFFLDDLDVSPDFLDYFQALYPLLVRDKTLYCISAWNDNGMVENIDRQASERRRDFISNKYWCF
jgi:alpha-1,3-mannosyl-glycoprotein beta-1,2-N-acetylglucosaminyltransferase